MMSSHETISSSEYDEQDREVIELLRKLGSFKSTYPSELLTARRKAFETQVERLITVDSGDELSDQDQKIVNLLGNLRAVQAEYPPHLLAARRSSLLRQLEMAEATSVGRQFRKLLQSIFQPKRKIPTAIRISLGIGSLIAAVWIGSLFFSRAEQSLQPSPSSAAPEPTHLPTSTSEVAIAICKPDDEMPPCPPGELNPNQDLADPGNGMARPAVSKDARSNEDGVCTAGYVNDDRDGTSWVSNSENSWIKIDLGQVTTINTVSLQKGSLDSYHEDDRGQFVIAVALSDMYADGDSSNDYAEYAQVFHSEQAGFSGTVSPAETIQTRFPPVQARFVKITFEKAGAAIEEVGVFLVEPPEVAEHPTRTPQNDIGTWTPSPTNTLLSMSTATSALGGTELPTYTAVPTITDTPVPADTPTPIPTEPLPTVIPPTGVSTTVQPSPTSTDTIRVTGSNQTLTFTCNGNAAEIRGDANTVTLLDFCSSITVTGNRNHVFWESGSPVITIRGRENIVQQL